MKPKFTIRKANILPLITFLLLLGLGFSLFQNITLREELQIEITKRDQQLKDAEEESKLLTEKLEETEEEFKILEKQMEELDGESQLNHEIISSLEEERNSLRKMLQENQEDHELLIRRGLVRVRDIDASVVSDLRYATMDNFTGKKVYPDNSLPVLRLETALKLKRANERFEKDGYRIKIWDAYRPRSVQEIFWALVPDPKFVADPAKGSVHNRGASVDITLVDLEGNELKMPTDYDDFSEKAARSYRGSQEDALLNMLYLTKIMEESGFKGLSSEWWHFDDVNSGYPLIEVSFDEFQ